VSFSGIAMEPCSSSGSIARTVHYFKKISGHRFWNDGIAYSGDLSVYPDKRRNQAGHPQRKRAEVREAGP